MSDQSERMFTFFFTDMEDSTRLWADFAPAMPGVMERHDAFLEAAIEAESGAVIRHTGDGMNAVFTDPRAAVRAAVQAQLAFRRADWSPLPRLGIRIAVHTGEALERAGDYLGISLSHAARLATPATAVRSSSRRPWRKPWPTTPSTRSARSISGVIACGGCRARIGPIRFGIRSCPSGSPPCARSTPQHRWASRRRPSTAALASWASSPTCSTTRAP